MSNKLSNKLKKNVPVLRFPEFEGDWEAKTLEKLSDWSSGGTPAKDNLDYWNGDIPWISASSMYYDILFDSDQKITELGLNNGSRLAPKGSILILVRGSMLYNRIPIGIAGRDLAFNQDVKALQVLNVNEIKYLFYWLKSKENLIKSKVSGTGIGAGKLDISELKTLVVVKPSIVEQEKIASFLGAVDTRLNQLRRKWKLLQTYKRGVMQKLFTHKIGLRKKKKTPEFRFPEFSGDWEPRKLSEFILKKDVTASDDIPLFSLTIEDGITEKTERYERSFLVKDAEEAYKLVEPNDFVYNPMNLRFGALARHKRNYPVKISKYYDVFSLDNTVNLVFIEFFLRNHNSIQYYNHMAEGSLLEKKRLHFSNFLEFIFLLPSLKEQEKIANFLTAIDRKIETLSHQIEQTEQFKKGLLQKLFV